MQDRNILHFVENAPLAPTHAAKVAEEEAFGEASVDLGKLPDGVVTSNTLIDYSAAAGDIRGGLSLAMVFASRAATAAMQPGDDEDDWLAAYKTNLSKLGFRVSQSSVTTSRFRKRGLFVHKALIPFLTIALGGAGVGPVMLALLSNLQEMDRDRPWITLFDRETRRLNSREMHFAAVSSGTVESTVRHVTARLTVASDQTNVLFFRITDNSAEFESATSMLTANNSLLAVLEQPLKERLADDAFAFIREATLAPH